ncbi:MAG: outer membrane lipoprotein chaperone LolA [Magnetococcales bacterium]|nr:outer membrane lipoprotein chaperone LolA [Magnetococcales bacterium]
MIVGKSRLLIALAGLSLAWLAPAPFDTGLALAKGQGSTKSEERDKAASREQDQSDFAAVTRLQQFINRLQTLEARFVQTVDPPPAGGAESRGTFYADKPNRFRWDYQTPHKQEIVSDGETIWYYDPDLEQATKKDAKSLENSPASFLVSGKPLEENFNWLVVRDEILKLPAVRLWPKKEGSLQEITVTLHPEQEELLHLNLVDSMGNRSSFRFSQSRLNVELPENRFSFTPPPGVDVILDKSSGS